jgi:uncharacterized protein (TIGR02246 family)
MIRPTLTLGAALSLGQVGGCATGAATHPDTQAIEAAAARFAEAFGRDDFDALLALYTPNARLLVDGGEPVDGLAAIREFFVRWKAANGAQTIRFSQFEFYGEDPVVTEVSQMEIRDAASGQLQARGKQILVRVKQDGQWRIHRDIWNGNGAVN